MTKVVKAINTRIGFTKNKPYKVSNGKIINDKGREMQNFNQIAHYFRDVKSRSSSSIGPLNHI